MRISKWIALVCTSPGKSEAGFILCVAIVAFFGWSWKFLVFPFLLMVAFEVSKYWPRRMSKEMSEVVMKQPVVHFTTPAQALKMARDGASLPGGKPGWVHIRPSAGRLDAVGLGGRKATYAFSGFPTPNVWLRNVGKHATAAIVIQPSALKEVRYRTGDGGLMLLGGYHGPAEIRMVRPDRKGQRMVLEPT
ncbi:hypothetical protein [Azospirillum soli]|uniref:hypothetical protein n=1 Tax=Azospirillum soli TaxID=1304799 RepID=UPI001AE9EF9C|nr:hypothetical protein [Azospirillum soli]MBP2311489.1 hypothetical protein [Azospirillum soli]